MVSLPQKMKGVKMCNQKVEIKIKGLYVNYSGVYGIKDNVSNQWLYVGAGKEMNNRFSTHISTLLSGKHRNKKLQEHFINVNGDITIVVLEYGTNLKELEEKWMEELKPLYSDPSRTGLGFFQSKNPESTRKRRAANLGSNNPNSKYDSKDIASIIWLKHNGYRNCDIAKMYKHIGISENYISCLGVTKQVHIKSIKPEFISENDIV